MVAHIAEFAHCRFDPLALLGGDHIRVVDGARHRRWRALGQSGDVRHPHTRQGFLQSIFLCYCHFDDPISRIIVFYQLVRQFNRNLLTRRACCYEIDFTNQTNETGRTTLAKNGPKSWVLSLLLRAATGSIIAISVVMVLVTLAQVFFRYVVAAPLAWSEELARYCFVWIVFLGGAVGLSRGIHLGVDLLVNLLPERFRAGLEVLAHVLIAGFAATVIYASYPVINMNMFQRSPALGVQMSWILYRHSDFDGVDLFDLRRAHRHSVARQPRPGGMSAC